MCADGDVAVGVVRIGVDGVGGVVIGSIVVYVFDVCGVGGGVAVVVDYVDGVGDDGDVE